MQNLKFLFLGLIAITSVGSQAWAQGINTNIIQSTQTYNTSNSSGRIITNYEKLKTIRPNSPAKPFAVMNEMSPIQVDSSVQTNIFQAFKQISPNNFLFGKEEFSNNILEAVTKSFPSVPNIFGGLSGDMSSLDILLQIAKNMSQEKTFQDAGMGDIDETELAVYAPLFEAARKAEGKNNLIKLDRSSQIPSEIMNLLK